MDNFAFLKYGTATLIMAIAVYVSLERNSVRNALNSEVLFSLRKAEKKVLNAPAKVAVGFGGCLDIFVDALPLLQSLNVAPPTKPQHHDVIMDYDDLAQGFAYFFRYGAAAERYFGNSSLFDEIVNKAKQQKKVRTAPGGNAPVMANRLALEGAEILLAAPNNDYFMRMINPAIKSTGTDTQNLDVHLIMEYDTGEKWGEYESERANRFIIHSDNSNPTIASLEPFISPMAAFDPKLLIVSGLQMLDNFPFQPGQRSERLSALRDFLLKPPSKTQPLIHFELASFVDESLMSDLIRYVAPYVDSFGMNEQELPNLESILKYGNITILSSSYPRVASVLDQMRVSYQQLRSKFNRVTRIHVHTLAFQAIMTRKGSEWKNTMSAAAHSSLTANRHVCGTKVVDLAKSKILMDESFSKTQEEGSARVTFKPDRPVSCWEEEIKLDGRNQDTVLICIAPNLVCTEIYQTVGGGDNISSAGLAMQI